MSARAEFVCFFGMTRSCEGEAQVLFCGLRKNASSIPESSSLTECEISRYKPGMAISKNLDSSWVRVLGDEFDKAYFKDLRAFLKKEADAGKTVFPQKDNYFAAFNATKFDDVRVVILGQDPYHGEGQAHGLCFSVQKGVAPPPSLLNIYKELEADLGIPRTREGHLLKWAKQGVLLLNSVLTVRESEAGSHRKRGWEEFTDRAIRELNDRRENLVFVLWGAYAQKKGAFIDRKRHFVIESVHPSPLSASRGFLGSRPFSKINTYLRKHGAAEIDWRVGD